MKTWKPDVCVYHGGCDDGFGAAWAIWRHWPTCEFIPGAYGKDLPDLSGKNVLFVDFSLKREPMLALGKVAKSVVVIDHHKTAEAELSLFAQFDGGISDLPAMFETAEFMGTVSVAVWFDMFQSGATMAWQFATSTNRKDNPPPQMLALIEDRDLWSFTYGDRTRQFSAALRIRPQDFAAWDIIAHSVDDLIAEGVIVLRAHEANLSKIIREAYWGNIGGKRAIIVNAPYHYASDAASLLLREYGDVDLAASWFKRADGQIQWSLRSTDDRADVSEIAKSFGGGGHRNSAGFQSSDVAKAESQQ